MTRPTREDYELLGAMGVKLPALKYASGSAELRGYLDYYDLESFDLECKCPFCERAIKFDQDSTDGDMECPHCKAGIYAEWGELVAELDVSVTLSPRLSEADRKYIAWKKENRPATTEPLKASEPST